MQTLRFIAGCALCLLGVITFAGVLVHLSQRGAKGRNGVFDIDEYRKNEQEGEQE